MNSCVGDFGERTSERKKVNGVVIRGDLGDELGQHRGQGQLLCRGKRVHMVSRETRHRGVVHIRVGGSRDGMMES